AASRAIRERVVAGEQHARRLTDPIGRYHVAIKWLAGRRIDYRSAGQTRNVSGALVRRRDQELGGSRSASSVAFVVNEKERPVFAIVDVGDRYGSAAATPKCVKRLRRFCVEPVDVGVERAVLEIFKGASMKLVTAAFGGNRHVAYLGELGIVVECSYFELPEDFGRRVQIG